MVFVHRMYAWVPMNQRSAIGQSATNCAEKILDPVVTSHRDADAWFRHVTFSTECDVQLHHVMVWSCVAPVPGERLHRRFVPLHVRGTIAGCGTGFVQFATTRAASPVTPYVPDPTTQKTHEADRGRSRGSPSSTPCSRSDHRLRPNGRTPNALHPRGSQSRVQFGHRQSWLPIIELHG